jgi:Helicase associated domain/Helicase conserved C-terminal domain
VVEHVNGAMRVADRKAILSGFTDTQKRLVTNARCLTEGVDLPAVDMVVFNNPRKSRIDIAQAVGRAMRKPREGDKTLGYVVVPVLLAPHETNDVLAACTNTDWEDVMDVVAALREQDTRLDEIIREQQVAKGGGTVFNPRAFLERVQVLGPVVLLDVLQAHIGSIILERLGAFWDERYGELVAFKNRHGHCRVPNNYSAFPLLAGWVGRQRALKRRGILAADRIRLLDAVGMIWEPQDESWNEMFRELVRFKEAHGHCNVPHDSSRYADLAKWIGKQRYRRTIGRLFGERITLLDSVGFVWDQRVSHA